MLVMPSNNTGIVVGYLAGSYPGRIGHLFSPEGLRQTHDWMPFALDNGKFACWSRGKPWDESSYIAMLDAVAERKQVPRWALVPDAVADLEQTKKLWDVWSPRIKSYGWKLAFAVQDGMTKDDVPRDADVVFVGGSTDWKWQTMYQWTQNFERVHVGRVNSPTRLWSCHEAGVESCDGTGWFRGDQNQLNGLITYLDKSFKGQTRKMLWT